MIYVFTEGSEARYRGWRFPNDTKPVTAAEFLDSCCAQVHSVYVAAKCIQRESFSRGALRTIDFALVSSWHTVSAYHILPHLKRDVVQPR